MLSKKTKLMVCIANIFAVINIFLNLPVFGATIPVVLQTIGKVLVVTAQIIVSGYFTIQLTIRGIQYFTAVAADQKAENKHAITWTLIQGLLAILGIRIFGKLAGLVD